MKRIIGRPKRLGNEGEFGWEYLEEGSEVWRVSIKKLI
ncbi:MAG: DUF2249 domain-containing protein [Tissierellia bacterium]|nr:DUF2249 domain-containing protein [Tissierellia bacterium]